MLIDFFSDGLNQPSKSKGIHKDPCSSLSSFLDYVLWTSGLAFTVGVAVQRDLALTSVIAVIAGAHRQNDGDNGACAQNGGHNNTQSCHCCQS